MDLLEAADRVRHDLGKYVAFSLRFLPEAPSDAELREALRDDLCRTRRDASGARDVGEVWADVRRSLPTEDPSFSAHVAALDAAVAGLVATAARLDALDRPALELLAEEARAAAGAARELAGALRSAAVHPRSA